MATKDFNVAVMELINLQQVFTFRVSQLMANYKIMDDILKDIDKKDATEYAQTALDNIDKLVMGIKECSSVLNFYRHEILYNHEIFD